MTCRQAIVEAVENLVIKRTSNRIPRLSMAGWIKD